jgi:hypothetical protein
MILDWASFLAYPNLIGIEGFVVGGVVSCMTPFHLQLMQLAEYSNPVCII